MKITFFGTSHGVPSGDRFCSCAFLEVNGKGYLFDCGAPAIEKMLKKEFDLTALKAVFITHRHGDHINGLTNLVDLSNWYFKNMSYDIYLPERELGERMKEFIEYTSALKMDEERLRLKLTSEGPFYDDGNIKVTAIRTEHMYLVGSPTYAYLIEADGKNLLITGDMSQFLGKEDFPVVAFEKKMDCIICEMAHFSLSDIDKYLKKCLANKFVFTHVFPLNKYDDIEKAKNDYGYPLICVADDDELEI